MTFNLPRIGYPSGQDKHWQMTYSKERACFLSNGNPIGFPEAMRHAETASHAWDAVSAQIYIGFFTDELPDTCPRCSVPFDGLFCSYCSDNPSPAKRLGLALLERERESTPMDSVAAERERLSLQPNEPLLSDLAAKDYELRYKTP